MFQEIRLSSLPAGLQNIPSPPRQLYLYESHDDAFIKLMRRPRVAIVGSRKVSPYGDIVTKKLASELAAQGVVIISGLAIGVDAIAHQAALEVGGLTMAILPGPVQKIYPAGHRHLARQILDKNGVIASEYPEGMPTLKQNFVARNRIVAGLADALLITEAAEKSGTMHTARFAIEQGIDVLAVPGNITSPTSDGTNNLIKAGAIPVTCVNDILQSLKLMPTVQSGKSLVRVTGANVEEQQIINLLEQGMSDGNELLAASNLTVERFNHNLTMLEITTKIRPLGANRWALR